MKEQLIKVKTAILAKEKGFNIPTLYFAFKNYNSGLDYVIVDELGCGQFGKIEKEEDHNNNSYQIERYSLPTQALLQKWLREIHNIVVLVGKTNKYSFTINEELYCGNENSFYETYEEALEEALFQGLNLIIMKYKIGDSVYIKSRYDGIVKRTIINIVSEENKTYELDDLVQITKNQYIGSSKNEIYQDDFFGITEYHFPAPEKYLFLIGEPIYNGLFGIYEGILTKKMIDYRNNYKDSGVSWKDFSENYIYCEKCGNYDTEQCICYTR